jgi:hypothetical protein
MSRAEKLAAVALLASTLAVPYLAARAVAEPPTVTAVAVRPTDPMETPTDGATP